MTEPDGRFGRWRRTAETAAASAREARTRLIRELATALAALVRGVRTPMQVVGVAPLPLALIFAVEGLILGGPGGRTAVVLAVLGIVPGSWLLLRRHRMVRAVDPVDELAGELHQAYDLAGVWSKAEEALRRVSSPGRGFRGFTRAAGGIWAGVRLTQELFDRFSDLPRVAPFLPVRLQTTLYLGIATLVSIGVLAVLCVLTFLTLVADAVV